MANEKQKKKGQQRVFASYPPSSWIRTHIDGPGIWDFGIDKLVSDKLVLREKTR